MKATHLHPQPNLSTQTLALLNNKPFLHGTITPFRPVHSARRLHNKHTSNNKGNNSSRVGYTPSHNVIRAMAPSFTDESIRVKVVLTVKTRGGSILSKVGIKQGLDDIIDVFGKSIKLGLVSVVLDPKIGREKVTIKGFANKTVEKDVEAKYECEFNVDGAFGFIGVVLVENEHHKEMYLEEIVFDGLLTLSFRSWVFDNPKKRVSS